MESKRFSSRIYSRGQTQVPAGVRRALDVVEGDELIYEIAGNAITVRKARPFDKIWHDAVASQLTEWNSKANDEAWNDL